MCRTCYGRDLAHAASGRHRRGGRHHRRPVHRRAGHAAHHAHVPHRRRRRRQDITAACRASRSCSRPAKPKGKADHQPRSTAWSRSSRPTTAARRVKVTSREDFDVPLRIATGHELLSPRATTSRSTRCVATPRAGRRRPTRCRAPERGLMVTRRAGPHASAPRTSEEREYDIPPQRRCWSRTASRCAPATPHRGPINPQEHPARSRGREAVQRYLVNEVQKVYRSQGVTINDKHIEIIVRQMLRKVRIDQPGDTELLPGELIDRFEFEEMNDGPRRGRRAGHGGARAARRHQGVAQHRAPSSPRPPSRRRPGCSPRPRSTAPEDRLLGLKENVIIGKLIPAGTGAPANMAAGREAARRAAAEALAGGELPEGFGDDFNPFAEGSAPLDAGEEFEAILGVPGEGVSPGPGGQRPARGSRRGRRDRRRAGPRATAQQRRLRRRPGLTAGRSER